MLIPLCCECLMFAKTTIINTGYLHHTTNECTCSAESLPQDKLCFHVFFCYQKSSESGETAIVSCKNCHDFNPKGFRKVCLLFWSLYNFKPVGSLIEVPILSRKFSKRHTHTQTHIKPDYSNPLLCQHGQGLNTLIE